jgi:glycosyltransferase involved in cell wall biosynthesis
MNSNPLVTIMIATKDRHEDLSETVRDLRRQDYPNLEMLVIDDASTPPIQTIVTQQWLEARVVRHEVSRGQCVRRNEGFTLAKGKYILHLDDDCSPAAAIAISQSVAYMEASPRCAAIAYQISIGREVPEHLDVSVATAGTCICYIGAAVFLRKAALEETAGYREFFISCAEEEELSLQLLRRGWSMSYRPEIVALHRCSPRNRNKPATWKRGLRNNIWIILIHYPLSRIPAEVLWKITVGACDAFRLKRGGLFLGALTEAIEGGAKVWKLRVPLDPLSLRRSDALRAYGVLPYGMFERPPAQRWQNFLRCAKRWRKKLSEASSQSKGT